MAEQVESLGLFVSFPDLSQAEPSKAMLKKLEKLKQAKEKKAQKAADKKDGGDKKEGGDKKGEDKKGQAPPEEEKK